ncbi:glycogen synthase, partial [Candidatus Microgenomates bacterium]|nr:glycogen synthase [Candidatus Microgenomates bacterium]
MKKRLKVLFVSAEVAPFVTIGGLSQVSYFLPKALIEKEVDVKVFLPKYGGIDEKKFPLKTVTETLRVPTGDGSSLICNVKSFKASKREPEVFFLENLEYYEKRANVYGYKDDHIRFALLSRGVLEFLKRVKRWRPDIIHCNDWHTGYLVNDLRTRYKKVPWLKKMATVLTIHNLRSQGPFDHRFASPLDFDDGKGNLMSFFEKRFKKQNSLKRGIIYADVVNTVSETYSREIMTAERGEGLNELLQEVRTKVFGVLNGLDYEEFSPIIDKIIKKNFSIKSLDARIENKIDLQRELGLLQDEKIPLVSFCSRLNSQKGIGLIQEILPKLLEELDFQFIVMGTGSTRYLTFFRKLKEQFPKKVGVHLRSDWRLPRKIFAGTDIFLLPSKFEPGGIVVIEGMRYGAVPLVRKTGGLSDIVTPFDTESNTGTGF